jgi:hypothetical protein
LVTQPAEREEGCFGERAPWVFAGPFTTAVLFASDAGVELTFGKCVVYPLPLMAGAQPLECAP